MFGNVSEHNIATQVFCILRLPHGALYRRLALKAKKKKKKIVMIYSPLMSFQTTLDSFDFQCVDRKIMDKQTR